MACVIFEMIAGRPPFVGETAEVIVAQQIDAPPPDIREFAPDAPDHTAAALCRALAKEPENRFETCGALAKQI